MEISGVSSKAYTSSAQGVEEEEELQEAQEEQTKEYGVSAKESDNIWRGSIVWEKYIF